MARITRADMGSPTPMTCGRCGNPEAQRCPLVTISEHGVKLLTWEMHLCRVCGFLGKAETSKEASA